MAKGMGVVAMPVGVAMGVAMAVALAVTMDVRRWHGHSAMRVPSREPIGMSVVPLGMTVGVPGACQRAHPEKSKPRER